MAVNNEIIDEVDQVRDAFNRLAINQRRRVLRIIAESEDEFQNIMSESKFQEHLKNVSEVFSVYEEPSDVRFRRIIGIMGLMCIVGINFAKRLIGFRSVNLDDQVILARCFIYEMTILWMASKYDDKRESIILPDDETYSRHSFTLAGLGDIADDLLDFALAMHSVNINSTELYYVYALSVFNEERAGLSPATKEVVTTCREEYMGSFEEYMTTKHESEASDRIAKLLDLIPKAKTVGRKFLEILNQTHKDTKFSPVFHEVWIISGGHNRALNPALV